MKSKIVWPILYCNSTHGGDGYPSGAFKRGDKLICPNCGAEMEVYSYANINLSLYKDGDVVV